MAPPIEKLIKIFSSFPSIGPRVAARFVFYLLKLSPKEFQNFIKAISIIQKEIDICRFCYNFYHKKAGQKKNICDICSNTRRDRTKILIVEKEIDLETLEKLKRYKGLYFVLGGVIKRLKDDSIKTINKRVESLIERIENPEKNFGQKIEEVILGLNPTAEGENTMNWIKTKLNFPQIKITRLSKGLPFGGELEYADEETLIEAIKNRK